MKKKIRPKLTAKEKKALKLKGINLEQVKKDILQELYTIKREEEKYTMIESNNQYEYKYQEYLNNTFNSRCVAMIVSFMNKTKFFPEYLKKTQKFFINLIQIIQKLMMNEIEISIFTLNIDRYDWENNGLNHELCLLFLGLYTKQITNKDCSLFFSKFRKENPKFFEKYQKWETSLKKEGFEINKINERFRELIIPHNSYCKSNIIDYNGVVDIIDKLSQPYGEENKGGKIKVKEEAFFDNRNMNLNNLDINMKNEFNNNNNVQNKENKINICLKDNPNLIKRSSTSFFKREPNFEQSDFFGNLMYKQTSNYLMKGNSEFPNFDDNI